MSHQPLRTQLLFLGEFSAESAVPVQHLKSLDVEQQFVTSIDQLAELSDDDVLVTDAEWFSSLSAEDKEVLQKKAFETAAWVALHPHNAAAASKLKSLRAGVTHILQQPVSQQHWSQLLIGLREPKVASLPKVMLVGSDTAGRTQLADCLRGLGCLPLEFDHPLAALDAMPDAAPDAVVTQTGFSGCTGAELASLIAMNPTTTSLPTVVLTDAGDTYSTSQSHPSQVQHHVPASLHPATLAAVIRGHALQYRAQQRAHERQQLEVKQLQQNLADLRYVLNEITVVNEVDTHGVIVNVNERFCETSGYSADELIGQSVKLLWSDAHPESFFEDIWETISRGEIWRGQMCNRRKNGGIYWLDGAVIPLLSAEGKPRKFISVRIDITKIKEQAQELRVAQELLKKSQTFANIGSWHWDVKKESLYWSEQVMAIMGLPGVPTRMKGYDEFSGFIHPDDRDRVRQAAEAAIYHDQPYDCEYRAVKPNGEIHWVQTKGAVTRDESGQPLHFLGVIQDINERKLAQLALAESERRVADFGRMLQTVLDNIPVRVYWKDKDLRYAGCNKSFAHDAGYSSPEKIIGLCDLSMPWVHTAQACRSEEMEIMRNRHSRLNQEESHTDRYGRAVWINSSKVPLINSQNEMVGILGMYSDITEGVKARQQLKESQERLVFAVEGAGDGIWDWNIDTGDLVFTGNYEEMLGYEKGEIGNHVNSAKQQVHPADVAHASVAMANYLAGQSPSYSVEMRLRCKNGDYKWVLSRGTIVARNDQGKPTRMIGVRSDISARKQSELELIQARESAERANQAKSDFLSSMSHELRTPLNAVLGFGQILEYDDHISEDQRDNVHEILKAGRHLLSLINEVLDLAKVESGKIDVSLEPVELMPVIDDCLRLIEPMAAKRGISLEFPTACDAVVRVDRTRFKQIILNLLSNAVKYNRVGGKISLKVCGDDRIRISVSDSGYGVSEQRLPELFQPFNRLNAESSGIEGTGIGLTITRRLIEIMGGSIGVASVVNEGTTFWVEFPADALDHPEDHHLQAAHNIESSSAVSRTVLCIDDNPTNLKLITQLLSRRPNIKVIPANTPSMGIELALAHQPEMILLDINMPGMNGYQVLEVLRNQPSLKDTCVIAVTANAMPRDIERGHEAGFADYVTKPLDAVEFLNTIDQHMMNLQKEFA